MKIIIYISKFLWIKWFLDNFRKFVTAGLKGLVFWNSSLVLGIVTTTWHLTSSFLLSKGRGRCGNRESRYLVNLDILSFHDYLNLSIVNRQIRFHIRFWVPVFLRPVFLASRKLCLALPWRTPAPCSGLSAFRPDIFFNPIKYHLFFSFTYQDGRLKLRLVNAG